MIGTVYLVGAGPGDPGLLTLRAARLLETAGVVVYDQLVGDAILDRLPAGAERIYAGKETGSHTMDQAAINAVLVDRARGGRTVVRLKGGDPFVFGRGGEEAEYLAEHGVPFEVVPGVTSAVGVPAYAGIPVTHRGVAASVAVVTGRAGPAGEAPDVDWARVAGADTIVVLMGVANHEALARALLDGGRSPETPVAAIRWGTTAQQQVVTGTLATIGDRMRTAHLRSPATLVIGEVVGLRSRLSWAPRRPLFGRRVLLPSAYPSPLTAPLESLGAEVLHVVPVELSPPPSWAPLDAALDDLRGLAGVIFADRAGVEAVRERLAARGQDARALAGLRIVAAGRAAARELRAFGILPDAVVDEAPPGWLSGAAGERWLVAGSPDGQQLVGALLARHGARGVAPPVSTVTTPKWRADRLRAVLTTHPAHAIVFGEPGDVGAIVGALDAEEQSLLGSMTLAAVGAATADALSRLGLTPAIRSTDAEPAAVAEALAVVLGPSPDDGSA
ncbi:MAG TPA: uroporphyrinogen-III C-methyltransferase [Methylomirabilota bacterium]